MMHARTCDAVQYMQRASSFNRSDCVGSGNGVSRAGGVSVNRARTSTEGMATKVGRHQCALLTGARGAKRENVDSCSSDDSDKSMWLHVVKVTDNAQHITHAHEEWW